MTAAATVVELALVSHTNAGKTTLARSGMPRRFEVPSGPVVFCAVLMELDATLGKALSIERIRVVD